MKEPRNGMQMQKLDKPEEFLCCKCGKVKKSKNIAIIMDDPSKKICNGCYGQTLAGK